MQRFFKEIKFSEILEIKDKGLFNQITRVLRSKIGDSFVFFNGVDFIDYLYVLKEIKKDILVFSKISEIQKNQEKNKINLYNSIPNKYEKIEYIIQKGSEVGVSGFYFFRSERSQNLKIDDKKIERFKKIIVEASEQSGRNTIPEIKFFSKLDIKNLSGENIFFHTKDENSIKLKDLKIEKNTINLFVGPEGGFSDKEVSDFVKNGFKKVILLGNILRTETVGRVTSFYIKQNYNFF